MPENWPHVTLVAKFTKNTSNLAWRTNMTMSCYPKKFVLIQEKGQQTSMCLLRGGHVSPKEGRVLEQLCVYNIHK